MVTVIKKLTGGAYPFYEYACLSTDIKPVSLVPDNSICHEIDTGKHFYCVNGTWHELPPRGGSEGGGGGGSSLPSMTGKNGKVLGVTLDAQDHEQAEWVTPSGGGSEKFVVTLTQENDTWTADKTIAEIVAADAAGKIVVCRVPFEDYNASAEIPCWFAAEGFAAFEGLITFDNALIVAAQIVADGEGTEVAVRTTPIPTSTNAPLIVTMTVDQSTGNLVGNKTYKEVYDAVDGGQAVTLKGNTGSITFATNALSVGLGNDGYSVAFVFGGAITEARGAANEYVMFTMN